MSKVSEKNSEKIRSIFSDVCARRGLLILVTQYLKFESRFVHLDGNEIHAATETGSADALAILGIKDVKLRFPHKLDFMEASTNLIGLGTHEGEKTIKFALPSSIYTADGRQNSRITQLDGAYATFRIGGRRLIRADMVDLSATGARLTMTVDLPHSEFRVKDKIMLSINLSDDITINSGAIVRHVKNRTFGVEFNPGLSDSDMISISGWFFKRQEERENSADNMDISAGTAISTAKGEGEILLVTPDDDLSASLGKLLGEKVKFRRVLPAIAPLQEALSKKPRLVILHMSDDSTIGRLLLKSLAENISSGLPTLLLGTGVDDEMLVETGLTCKAAFSVLWTPNKSLFLQRLVLGVLRRHYS